MKHCLIFSRKIFYVTIVLCLNILWLKAVSEITGRQTRKQDVIKVCSIEYLITEIELMLPTLKSLTVHRIIEYLTLGLLSSLWNIYHGTTAYFFDPPCTVYIPPTPIIWAAGGIKFSSCPSVSVRTGKLAEAYSCRLVEFSSFLCMHRTFWQHIGWQWRNFVPYLCRLIFVAIM